MKIHFLFFMLQADSQADMLKIQVFWDVILCQWASSC